jgi:hypothetical protein
LDSIDDHMARYDADNGAIERGVRPKDINYNVESVKRLRVKDNKLQLLVDWKDFDGKKIVS